MVVLRAGLLGADRTPGVVEVKDLDTVTRMAVLGDDDSNDDEAENANVSANISVARCCDCVGFFFPPFGII